MFEKSDYICSIECNDWQTKIGIILIDIGMLIIWKWLWLNKHDLILKIGENLGIVLAAFLFIESFLQVFWTIQIFKNGNSYIRVYEDHMEGVTRVPFYSVDSENEVFSLEYHEVLNIEMVRSFIRIDTPLRKYEVMALENNNWALAEIRKRLPTKN